MIERTPTVVIIGAGFSGTVLAANLLRLKSPVHVVLLNRFGPMGRGVAYGTGLEAHVLNVPAGSMSAFDDDPDHFLRYAQRRDPELKADSFVSRRFYGEYLESVLQEAVRESAPETSLDTVVGEAESLRLLEGGEGVEVILSSPESKKGFLCADRVVLALGNYSPADPLVGDPSFYATERYIRDPWVRGALDIVRPGERVLLIGTGLTMMDIALDLTQRRVALPLHAVSRHGLLPQAHERRRERAPGFAVRSGARSDEGRGANGSLRLVTASRARSDSRVGDDSVESSWDELVRSESARVSSYFRAVRARIQSHGAGGGDWRDVVSSLRAITPTLWQALPPAERARFLRHVRAYWDTHRHLAAPRTRAAIADMIEKGVLTIHSGRILSYRQIEQTPSLEHSRDDRVDSAGRNGAKTESHAGRSPSPGDSRRIDHEVEIEIRPRGSTRVEWIAVDRVVNCTGPDCDVRRIRDSFLPSLLEKGLIRSDPMGLGLETSDDGALLDAQGRASTSLYLLGPLLKGRYWEATAVPELRRHAAVLARTLTSGVRLESLELGGRTSGRL